jgi:tRNA pseudouridine55 synthase
VNGGAATPALGLLVDKPAGVTSHDVVMRIRRERGGKVGHAGTLDPFATGLLVVLLGRATRLQRYLLDLPKTYVATARLGWRSTTGDPDGELTETGRIPERLELPTGEIKQRVPMTSAVKVAGERLYKKAHRGEAVETPTRRVTVHRVELLESDAQRAIFEIECSSGTYVRTLIETLEDAYCESLRRTAIGDLRVPDDDQHEISVEQLMSFLPEIPLDSSGAERARHGVALRGVAGGAPERVRLTHEGRLIAIARVEDEHLSPEVVLT